VCAGVPDFPSLLHHAEVATSYSAAYVVERLAGTTRPAIVAEVGPVARPSSVWISGAPRSLVQNPV
jgi:hypothetical protein